MSKDKLATELLEKMYQLGSPWYSDERKALIVEYFEKVQSPQPAQPPMLSLFGVKKLVDPSA
jgi:hypothetical protein